jgi:hypothetical protein
MHDQLHHHRMCAPCLYAAWTCAHCGNVYPQRITRCSECSLPANESHDYTCESCHPRDDEDCDDGVDDTDAEHYVSTGFQIRTTA